MGMESDCPIPDDYARGDNAPASADGIAQRFLTDENEFVGTLSLCGLDCPLAICIQIWGPMWQFDWFDPGRSYYCSKLSFGTVVSRGVQSDLNFSENFQIRRQFRKILISE
jgi:hypothetical protein